MRLNKKDLIDRMAASSSETKASCSRMLDLVLQEITSAVEEGNEVMLLGFGRFYGKARKGRVGRNPKTGEAINIAPRRAFGFSASKILHAVEEVDTPQEGV